MSVGHVARLMEAGGIATVIVASQVFRAQLEKMHLPRVLLTPHVAGHSSNGPSKIVVCFSGFVRGSRFGVSFA